MNSMHRLDDWEARRSGLSEGTARNRGSPRVPRQPFNEAELIAGCGLLLILAACAVYLAVRLFS